VRRRRSRYRARRGVTPRRRSSEEAPVSFALREQRRRKVSSRTRQRSGAGETEAAVAKGCSSAKMNN
jgi:hypothetical protein